MVCTYVCVCVCVCVCVWSKFSKITYFEKNETFNFQLIVDSHPVARNNTECSHITPNSNVSPNSNVLQDKLVQYHSQDTGVDAVKVPSSQGSLMLPLYNNTHYPPTSTLP